MNNLLKEIETTVTSFLNENSTEYIEKLLNWTTKKIKIHFKKDIDSVVFKKYEIYWINFGMNIGTEFSGRRPGLIIKNNAFIRGKDIVVLPITSQKDNKDYGKFDILITKSEVNGLSKDSVVKMEQIKTISKLRIGDSLGKLDEEYVEIIESKFKKLFL